MDNRQIIQLYFDCNDDAIVETDRKYGRSCLALSKNIVGNRLDAEGCVNDTYLGLWNAIPPARPDPFSSFIFISLARYHANHAAKRDNGYNLSLFELEECIGDGGLSDSSAKFTDEDMASLPDIGTYAAAHSSSTRRRCFYFISTSSASPGARIRRFSGSGDQIPVVLSNF